MPTDRSELLRLERITLDGGLEVTFQRAPAGSASFSASLIVPAGWGFDPRGREGLSRLVSELVVCGAGRFDRRALAQELDRRGATLSSDCDAESAEVTVWGPASRLDELLPRLADAALRPRFDAPEAARLKRELVERRLRELRQPDQRAHRELFRAIYPADHPYHGSGLGTSRSVGALGRTRLLEYHRRQFRGGGAHLVLTVPARRRPSAAALQRSFGELTSAGGPVSPSLPSSQGPPAREQRIPVPGGSQVEVWMGGTSVARSDPSYPAAFLANAVLGGRSLLSRLFQNLREKRGLVYHAASSLESLRWGGYWTARAGTDPKRVDQVHTLLAAEVTRLGEQDPTPSELRRIRESAIGSVWLDFETTASAHELALDAAYFGLPDDFYLHWPEMLREVSPRRLRETAAEAFAPARACTVLAGPLPG